ncbi:MAG: DUF2812 domain-containing protein [Lachnospiraceae bacterium]|nr:DUF2812 domain-containing protein [Lachnospiraceae bacterium]
MAAVYKRSFKIYSAWNYEQEIEDLNRASAEGWQLVRGGCFSSRFVKNPDIEYRYQIDYQKIDDMGRYIEIFREQGWEYINSTFNGWHYFRKLYDPSLPEEAYEIFTDRESIMEMNGRWARFAGIICIFLAVMAVISGIRLFLAPKLPALVQFLMFAIEGAVLFRGWLIMRNPDADRSRRGDSAFITAFFAIILIGAAVMLILTETRPYFETSQRASSIDAPIVDNRWGDFTVRYPDNYYLDLEFEADTPLTFSIVNAAGEAVYTVTETRFDEEDIRVRLTPGKYQLSMSVESGFEIEVEMD